MATGTTVLPHPNLLKLLLRGSLGTATALFQSEEAIRAERRELMKRVSDEALMELDAKTAQLAAKRR